MVGAAPLGTTIRRVSDLIRPAAADTYFVGGVSLSGKALVASELIKSITPGLEKVPYFVSTDGLRSEGWDHKLDEAEPALVQMHKDRRAFTAEQWLETARENPDYFVDRQHRECEVVWRRGLLAHHRPLHQRGHAACYEGVAVLPQHVSTFPHPHRAVFVGNVRFTEKHYENVMDLKDRVPDHYMHDWSEEKIRTYMENVTPAYSRRLRTLADRHGYKFFDLSRGDHREVQQEAAEWLEKQPLVEPGRAREPEVEW